MRTVVGKLKRKLRDQTASDAFNSSQTAVLHRLETDGPVTVSNLARAEGMRPQSMSAVISPLMAARLVSGKQDPNDGRQTLLSLTKKCKKLIHERRVAKQDWLTGMIQAKLSTREQAKLFEALVILERLIED